MQTLLTFEQAVLLLKEQITNGELLSISGDNITVHTPEIEEKLLELASLYEKEGVHIPSADDHKQKRKKKCRDYLPGSY